MKKLILIISAFFILFIPSFPSHAELMPPSMLQSGLPSVIPSGEVLDMSSFGQQMPTYYFESQGFDLMGETWEDAIHNFNGLEIDPDYTWSHKPLTDFQWPSTSTQHLYDSNGNEVPFSEAGYIQGQNNYSGVFGLYSLETGEILNIGSTYDSSVSTVNASVTSDFWALTNEVLSHFGPSVPTSPLAIYNPYETTTELVDYYYNMPHSAYWYDSVHDIGCFVSNVNETDSVYVQTASGGNSFVVYFNDNASVDIWNNWEGGGGWQNVVPQQGSFGVNGNTYGWRFPPLGLSFNITNMKAEATNTLGKRDDDVTYYTPQEPYELPDTINRDKKLDNPVNKYHELNENFDSSDVYNYYNYIFNTETTSPDVYPTYNYITNIYNYITQPSETEGTQIQPEEFDLDVPILSNLQYRFPFSIPFDLMNLFKEMSVLREAPHFEWVISIPVINYDWEIDIDLSMWNSQASIFRTCFMILFIIGLAKFAYDHYFGT